MTALDKVFEWADGLPDWLSDAARRILTKVNVSDEDVQELKEMLKKKNGLPCSPKTPAPIKLRKTDVSGSVISNDLIVLKNMTDLKNVNALASNQTIPFGHEGLTVVYGENGTGKSSYSRVLKSACSARDVEEAILSDVFSASANTKACATFKYAVGDKPDEIFTWIDNGEKSKYLSHIAVFDSKCARVIISEKNAVTYQPYGTEVFESLVKLLKRIKDALESEMPKPAKPEIATIPHDTVAGQFLASLGRQTSVAQIETNTKWSLEDAGKLSSAEIRITELKAKDPATRIRQLRALKGRIDTQKKDTEKLTLATSDEVCADLAKCITSAIEAEKALKIATEEVPQEPLKGVGGNAWRQLYEAAKAYSTSEAYVGDFFPNTKPQSRCVLCQQEIAQEGRDRYERFRRFMEQDAKKEFDSALQNLEAALKPIKDLKMTEIDEDLIIELDQRKNTLGSRLRVYRDSVFERARGLMSAGKTKQWKEQVPLVENPTGELSEVARDIEEDADALAAKSNPEEIQKLNSSVCELKARSALSLHKQSLRSYLEESIAREKYDLCISETDSVAITRRGKQIISESVTPELINALEKEMSDLGIDSININIKPWAERGSLLHQFELKNTTLKKQLTSILSEGEQRVIAIAGFLAELEAARSKAPIVLDDPVSSLDHRYRERIARRLVSEAAKRQVIVFTHDIAFLLHLQNYSESPSTKVPVVIHTLNKQGRVAGIPASGEPWHAMKVAERINFLSNIMIPKLKALGGDQKKYNREASYFYSLLRETWEAVVEEKLFMGTIKRFDVEVRTLMLRYVQVTDEDYEKIYFAMTKSSSWMVGHDKARALDANRPPITEMEKDLQELQTYLQQLKKKGEEVEKKRKGIIQPVKPKIG